MSSQAEHSFLIGVVNPYALAEVKIGHRIQWDHVSNPRMLLEQILGYPYDRLFDPKYDSPLYPGLKYHSKTKTLTRDEDAAVFAASTMEMALLSMLKLPHEAPSALKEQTQRPIAATDAKMPVREIEHAKKERFDALRLIDPNVLVNGFDWIDPGHFFTDAASPLDAIQGALADCYFVAALASVAWSRPFTIVQRTRQTDVTGLFTSPGAVDLILFWNGTQWDRIEVTEMIPLQPPSDIYIYTRSDDSTESWSAVYEKAFAMWHTHDTSNYPNYMPIAYGDPVAATIALTGLQGISSLTMNLAPHDIWQAVRAHSRSFKAFDPMVAWTYPSSAAAPTPIDYDSAALVANPTGCATRCTSAVEWLESFFHCPPVSAIGRARSPPLSKRLEH